MSWAPGRKEDVAADGGGDAVGGVELRAPPEAASISWRRVSSWSWRRWGLVEGLGGAQEHVEEGAEGAEDEYQQGGEEADVDVLGAAADVLPGPDEGGGPDGGAERGQQGKGDGDGLADGLHGLGLLSGGSPGL